MRTAGRFVGLAAALALVAAATASAKPIPAVSPASSHTTTAGLEADGVRWQALAAHYQQLESQRLNAAEIARWQAIGRYYPQQESRTAASYYTPQALAAWGQRWEALARSYQQRQSPPAVSLSQGASGFDWSDAGIGAAGGLGIAALAAASLLYGRRFRRSRFA